MTHRSTEPLRDQILELLASGRAVSSAELRARLRAMDDRVLTLELVHRQLAVLVRRGDIVAVARRAGRTYWARPGGVHAQICAAAPGPDGVDRR